MNKISILLVFIFTTFQVCTQQIRNLDSTLAYDAAEGAMSKHLYSSIISFTNVNGSEISATKTFGFPFFDNNEKISYATSLVSFQSANPNSSTNLTIFVKTVTTNSARTAFTIQLELVSQGQSLIFSILGYHIILIGSNFNTNFHPLSSGFARNSVPIVTKDISNTSLFGQFNFTSPEGNPSPFDYFPDSNTVGCGVSESGGISRIEAVCSKPIFLVFTTGFSLLQTGPGQILSMSSLLSQSNLSSSFNPVANVELNQNSQSYIFRQTINDDKVGLIVKYRKDLSSMLQKLQLSFVFIGLRDFQPDYPVQNSVNQDSFLVSVGALGTPFYNRLIGDTTNLLVDGFKSGQNDLDLKTYNTQTNMGHVFCGLQFIQSTASVTLKFTQGAQPASGKILMQRLNQNGNAAASCMFFSLKTPCINTKVPISTPLLPAKMQLKSNSPNIFNRPVIVPNFALSNNGRNQPEYKFTINYLLNPSWTTAQIKNPYNLVSTTTQYIFSLEVKPASASAPTGTQMQAQVTINGITYPKTTITGSASVFLTYRVHLTQPGTQLLPSVTIRTTNYRGNKVQIWQRLYEAGKVLDSSLQCTTNCGDSAGISPGVSSVPSTPPQCIYCQTELNQIYFNGECKCKQSHFAASGACPPCQIAHCSTCNTTTCTLCVTGATLTNGQCSCSVGTYTNENQCLPCPIGCAACTSPTTCTSCKNSTNDNGFQTRDNISCECKPGYFDVQQTPICSLCSPICLTCSQSATTCTSCNLENHFIQDQNTCICAAGYYLQNQICVACGGMCSTCSVNSTNCLSCPIHTQLVNNTCVCVTGFIQVNSSCVDSNCSLIDTYCQTCSFNFNGVQAMQCDTCVTGRQLVQGHCLCRPGTYQNNGICLSCGLGCQACTGPNNCQTCTSNSINNGNGSCTCSSGFVLVTSSSTPFCQACNRNCLTCSGSPTTCTTCRSGLILSGSTCVCRTGYFGIDGVQCFPCTSNCQSCNNPLTCSVCNQPYLLDDLTRQCRESCPAGSYNIGFGCQSCPTGCQNCLFSLVCTTCQPNYALFLGSCRSSCPNRFYNSSGKCQLCPLQCNSCSNQTTCTSCTNGLVLLSGQCVPNCVNNTYHSNGACLPCDSNCTTCSGSSTPCTSCIDNYTLFQGVCYSQCPGVILQGVCSETCPPGRYISGNNCLPCSSGCNTCSNSSYCDSCLSGFSYNGTCQNSCPASTFPLNQVCVPCDQMCATCSINPYNCLTCPINWYKLGSVCLRSCPAGYYTNQAAFTCTSCGLGCRQCTMNGQCLTCFNQNETPVGANCQFVCPSGSTQVNGICVCTFGNMHQNTCVSSCPSGFYASANRTCEACNSPCLTCANSPDICLSCVAGYDLTTNRTCNRNSSCPYGQFFRNGRCQAICVTGVFFSGGCLFQCPNGFIDNGFGGCIQATNPSICQSPLFRQGSSCVGSCLQGYWPNQMTRVCQLCSQNCAVCFTQTFCTTCASGFILNADRTACIVSSQCSSNQYQYNLNCYSVCPAGTYAQGRICVRSCPVRSYFYNGLCYSSCPTPFYNPDACLPSCGSYSPCWSNSR